VTVPSPSPSAPESIVNFAPNAMLEGVLSGLLCFDPSGVFARSLGECLALQLKDRNRYENLREGE
jgi:DNA-directed RNA polymerase specialized sigma54-like protein